MKTGALFFACLICARAADDSIPPGVGAAPAENAAAPAAATKTIEHDGQTFKLASSATGKNVETDEYVQAGETLADWTQLLTVQRMTLAKATPTDEFVAYFQKRIQAESGATLQILKQSKAVSVFAVRFPKSDGNDEQVMICLALTDPAKTGVLNIVQYAIKPTRLSVDLVEMRIKSWRDRFLHQSEAISRGQP
jgi:hypothetical protein